LTRFKTPPASPLLQDKKAANDNPHEQLAFNFYNALENLKKMPLKNIAFGEHAEC
jgi:hypothetical protein